MLSLFLLHAAGSGTTSYASETVRDAVRANSVVIFSQSQCPLSEKTKAYFEDLGVPYYALELDTRADGSAVKQALAQLTGAKSVPRVFVNGQHVGGSTETARAYSTGELEHWVSSERVDL
uniref:Glutaredoxin domain-containing protein n=1 Tax=Prymnesium polylepis TaxID=72548 RepID=A0A6V3ZA13_9EUKA|mmetsp:Transcript_69864/g.191681  ORF Transcript_69864/g.191681 Transcript_69864/m.191681 type:complete len:120 (+) Transcript_69864:55-414(+)